MVLRKIVNTVLASIAIISSSLLGFLGGRMIVEGKLSRWKSLGSPPEKAVRIAGGYVGRYRETCIYVETVSGTIYHYCEEDKILWHVTPESEVKQVVDYGCLSDDKPHVTPPKGAIDEIAIHWCGEWDWGQANYIIRDDGSVWLWRYSGWFPGWIVPICGGPVLGWIVGVFIVRVIVNYRNSKWQEKNTLV